MQKGYLIELKGGYYDQLEVEKFWFVEETQNLHQDILKIFQEHWQAATESNVHLFLKTRSTQRFGVEHEEMFFSLCSAVKVDDQIYIKYWL